MKKLLVAGVLSLSALTLSACGASSSAKNSAEAKDAYITNVVKLNSKAYNAADVTMKVAQFKASGQDVSSSDLKKVQKYLTGSDFDVKVVRDSSDKTASLSGTATVDNQPYGLNFIMGEDGMYIKSSDIKSLYKTFSSSISSSTDAYSASIYKSMVDALNTPYLILDAKTLNSSLSSSDQNWGDMVDQMINQPTTTKASLTKSYKDIPASDFSKKGDKITLKMTAKNGDVQKLLKKAAAANPSISAAQLDKVLKESKNTKVNYFTLTSTLNTKTHKTTAVISTKVSDTKDDSSFAIKLDVTSKVAKASGKVVEPAKSQAKTIADAENDVIAKITQDASANTGA